MTQHHSISDTQSSQRPSVDRYVASFLIATLLLAYALFVFVNISDSAPVLVLGLFITTIVTALSFSITSGKAKALELAEEITKDLRKSESQKRKLAKQADQAHAAKAEFLTNMSHEFRTPITAILGYTDIIAEFIPTDQSPDDIRLGIHRIKESAADLLGMFDNLLDLSIIENADLVLNPSPCYIPEILSGVLASIKPHIEHRALILDAQFETPIPATINADSFRIKQILTNILSNAVKFTDQGTITLRIRADESTIKFAITDTGIGIESSKLNQLFESFQQADSTVTRLRPGIGLGLTVANHLAQLMQGSLSATSSQDPQSHGSTFTLTIPINLPDGVPYHTITQLRQDPESAGRVTRARRHSDFNLNNTRVLLVEDGHDNQRLITHFLEKAGIQVELAENGQLALDRYQSDPEFHLIIMDMQMPVLDGYQTTKHLRDRGCTLPILALTAHAMSGDRQRCLDAGCDGYQTKPVNRIQLLQSIEYLINQQQSEGQSAA